jgi:hypothetical protein
MHCFIEVGLHRGFGRANKEILKLRFLKSIHMILILGLFNYANLTAEVIWRWVRWEDANERSRQPTCLRLLRQREKSVVAYFKIVFRQSPRDGPTEKNHEKWKTSVRTAGNPAKFWTWYFLNTSQKHYRYTSLLGEKLSCVMACVLVSCY